MNAQTIWGKLPRFVVNLRPDACLLSSAGTVGDSLSASQHPDVFVSTDGGYNWRGTLRGPHHYSILDSGGLVVAVEAHHEGQVKTIKYHHWFFRFCITPQLSCGDICSNLWFISHLQVFHRWRPVLEILQLHWTAILLCRPGVWAWHQGTERQRVGLQARGGQPAHVGGCHHWLPESDYKRVWVLEYSVLFPLYFGLSGVERGRAYNCAPPEGVKVVFVTLSVEFLRYWQRLRGVVGTFWSYRRRLREERLCSGHQGDLQEAQEAFGVQKWQSVHSDQEPKLLPVHQGGFLMVGWCICHKATMFDSLVIMFNFPQWLWLLSPWEYFRVREAIRQCRQNPGTVSEWRGGWAFHSRVLTMMSLTATCPLHVFTHARMCAGTVRFRVIGAREDSPLNWQCRLSSDPAALNPAQVHLPGTHLQPHTLTPWSVHHANPFMPLTDPVCLLKSVWCFFVFFPAWEAGVDPSVCWHRGHCAGGCCLCSHCSQEGGLQTQVSRTYLCCATRQAFLFPC